MRVAIAAAAGVAAAVTLSAPAAAGLVHEARRQVGDPGLQLHRYRLLDDGGMFQEAGDDLTWLDWRALVYVRTEIESTGPEGGVAGWLVMAERAPIAAADVGRGSGGDGVGPVDPPRPVPLPASIWSMLGAVGGLAAALWRQRRARCTP